MSDKENQTNEQATSDNEDTLVNSDSKEKQPESSVDETLNKQKENNHSETQKSLVDDTEENEQVNEGSSLDLDQGSNNEDRVNTGIIATEPSTKKMEHISLCKLNDNQKSTSASSTSSESNGIDIKYNAKHVIIILIPVSLCMLVVFLNVKFLRSFKNLDEKWKKFIPEEYQAETTIGRLGLSLVIALAVLTTVIVATVVMMVLYIYRFYKVLRVYLIFSTFSILFFISYNFFGKVQYTLNIALDFITVMIILWNILCVGMFCIQSDGPLVLQQFFLIMITSLMALKIVEVLPDWTVWTFLILLSIWDLVAVLCPFGPLRLLIETIEKREEEMLPGLLYSCKTTKATIVYTIMMVTSNEVEIESKTKTEEKMNAIEEEGDAFIPNPEITGIDNKDDDERFENWDNTDVKIVSGKVKRKKTSKKSSDSDEENGIKLGLGDFVFYSVLIGKAALLDDFNTVIACYVAILIGLCFTLVLLAVFQKALPALPISLTFGLIFCFCTNLVVRPFYDGLSAKLYFI